MDHSRCFRRSLLVKLLIGASLPLGIEACLTMEERCFSWNEAACPSRDEAINHIPHACDEVVNSVDSNAAREGDECCYNVTIEHDDKCVMEGRPLAIGGRHVVARTRRGDGWLDAVRAPRLDHLSPAERAERARRWTDAALAEHASIASFSRHSLELMALGAPRELIEAAQRAALDEVAHARASFALASAYAGYAIEPGPLPLPNLLSLHDRLEDFAVATLLEGCINETLALVVAAEELATADDPAVSGVLERIIAEETEHSLLAWKTLQWACSVGGHSVKRAVARAAERALSCDDTDITRERGIREVVRPCLDALLTV